MAKIEQYKKKDGKTYYRVINLYLGMDETTGKKIYVSKSGFKKNSAAQSWIGQEITKVEKYGLSNSKNNDIKTFMDLTELWRDYKKDTVKPSTMFTYNNKLNNCILPQIGDWKLSAIKPAKLQRIVNYWTNDHKDYSYTRSLAIQIFNYAVSLEIIHDNPMTRTILPRRPKIEKKSNYLTKEQLKEFLDFTNENDSIRNYTFFRLLAYTGMRKGEALALQWKDIDFEHGRIKISKTLAVKEHSEVYLSDSTKTGLNREITVDAITLNTLSLWKKEQLKIYFQLGLNILNEQQFIFTSLKNKILDPRCIDHWLNGIYKKYNKTYTNKNIHRITPHGFRHTHASLLLEAGVPIKEVSERLGHTDIQTTLNIYAHVNRNQEDKSAQTFAKFMEL